MYITSLYVFDRTMYSAVFCIILHLALNLVVVRMTDWSLDHHLLRKCFTVRKYFVKHCAKTTKIFFTTI